MAKLRKIQGWEKQLAYTIEAYKDKGFLWGKTDCIIFIADCLLAITQEDVLYDARDMYSSEDEGYQLRKQEWEDRFEYLWESRTSKVDNPLLAQRGDIALLDIEGKEHCGIVYGTRIFVRTQTGLMAVKISKQLKVKLWRI